jgi:hypothetical protein
MVNRTGVALDTTFPKRQNGGVRPLQAQESACPLASRPKPSGGIGGSSRRHNDQTPQAMGLYMNQKGIKKAFLIGPNYAVGRDMLAGLRLTFQGEVLGQEMTRWPDSSIFRPSFPRPARRSPTPSLRSTRAAPACSSSPSTCRRASASLHAGVRPRRGARRLRRRDAGADPRRSAWARTS